MADRTRGALAGPEPQGPPLDTYVSHFSRGEKTNPQREEGSNCALLPLHAPVERLGALTASTGELLGETPPTPRERGGPGRLPAVTSEARGTSAGAAARSRPHRPTGGEADDAEAEQAVQETDADSSTCNPTNGTTVAKCNSRSNWRRWRTANVAAGLCAVCGAEKDRDGLCSACNGRHNAHGRKVRAERKAAGLCIRCGKKLEPTPHRPKGVLRIGVHCEEHRADSLRRQKESRKARRRREAIQG